MADLKDNVRFIKLPWRLLRMGYVWIARYLSPYEHALWWFIVMKTLGYQKDLDWISNSQIENSTGIPLSHVPRTKKKLLEKKMITRDGRKIGIEQDAGKWVITVTKGKRKSWKIRIDIKEGSEVKNGKDYPYIEGRMIWVKPS
ncbi:MAG: replication protein [Candidatus Omnitrophica bacterium]|nr:replication protein [Candidatus Omnitrophota bacterium]